ncbi:unnamed protein product, partial [Durusdinium trenchii]
MAAVTSGLMKIPQNHEDQTECPTAAEDLQLHELGVLWTSTMKSEKANPSELGPEEYAAEIETNNKLAFWMVLSDEQLVDLRTEMTA